MKIIQNVTLLSLLVIFLSACGGSGVTANTSQQKTVTMTFSSYTSTTVYSAPLQLIHLTVHLPDGVTGPCTATGINDTGQLNDFPATAFSAIDGTYTFTVTQAKQPLPISLGMFATLTCTVKPGHTFHTVSEFPVATLFPGNAGLDIKGDDTVNLSLIDLIAAQQLRVDVSEVSFGF